MFPNHPQTIIGLRAPIFQFIRTITEEMWHQIINNLRIRFEEVIRRNVGHTEHVINRR